MQPDGSYVFGSEISRDWLGELSAARSSAYEFLLKTLSDSESADLERLAATRCVAVLVGGAFFEVIEHRILSFDIFDLVPLDLVNAGLTFLAEARVSASQFASIQAEAELAGWVGYLEQTRSSLAEYARWCGSQDAVPDVWRSESELSIESQVAKAMLGGGDNPAAEAKAGQIVEVPLSPVRSGFAWILDYHPRGEAVFAASGALWNKLGAFTLPVAPAEVIGSFRGGTWFVSGGRWQVLGELPGCVLKEAKHLLGVGDGCQGESLAVAGPIELHEFLMAYHRLGPWSQYPGGPDSFDYLLRDPSLKPTQLVRL